MSLFKHLKGRSGQISVSSIPNQVFTATGQTARAPSERDRVDLGKNKKRKMRKMMVWISVLAVRTERISIIDRIVRRIGLI